MASTAARVGLRLAVIVLICVLAFYVGRPLYWKLSASLQEVREKNYGLSQLMHSARKSVGWIHDESDAGVVDGSTGKVVKVRRANFRRLAHFVEPKLEELENWKF
eukprot:Gb_21606 [translate_table: standard]